MRPTYLLIVSLMFSSALAIGQAQPTDNSAPRSHPANVTDVPATDQFHIGPSLLRESNEPNASADDPIKAQSESRRQLIRLLDAQRNAPGFVPGPNSWDVACFAIRSYRVVRDDPHSDSTHRDGYTTCVPSARFRFYAADERR